MWPTHYMPLQGRVDGNPPPRFYLTSPPYPLEQTEDFRSAATFTSGAFAVGAEDEIVSGGSFVSGTLQDILVTYNNGIDEIRSSASFASGVLKDVLVTYDNRFDQIKSTGAFVSGALADPLVIYDNWPLGVATEDLQSAASFVSGTLL